MKSLLRSKPSASLGSFRLTTVLNSKSSSLKIIFPNEKWDMTSHEHQMDKSYSSSLRKFIGNKNEGVLSIIKKNISFHNFHINLLVNQQTHDSPTTVPFENLIDQVKTIIPQNARELNYEQSKEKQDYIYSIIQQIQSIIKEKRILASEIEWNNKLKDMHLAHWESEFHGLKLENAIDVLLAVYYYHQFGGNLKNRSLYNNIFSSIDHAIQENSDCPLLYHLKGIFFQKYARDISLPTFKQDEATQKCKEGIECFETALNIYEKKGINNKDLPHNENDLLHYYAIHSDVAILNLWLSNMYKSLAYVKPNISQELGDISEMEKEFHKMMQQQMSQQAIQEYVESKLKIANNSDPVVVDDMEKAFFTTGEKALQHFRKSFEYVKEPKAVFAYAGALFLMERPEEAADGYAMLLENGKKLYNQLKEEALQKEAICNYSLCLFHLERFEKAIEVLQDAVSHQFPNEAPLQVLLLHLKVQQYPKQMQENFPQVIEQMRQNFYALEQLERETMRGDLRKPSYDPKHLQFFKQICTIYLSNNK
ncbi:hypothetical protein C9374_010293 [Naegleria lovaniensis]|uniref:Tetratricopeptide repeat protein n=1 Tax=Naegleria lovaniensis TaxID=51637 RepID=A0AA88GGL4_NAELO|nr:uncharacterized protein C9374_010293 [Naegleria lovaniensis]KAG2374919.1 hypothetical protein C9374_010293 [Naegleria lovaniensis]